MSEIAAHRTGVDRDVLPTSVDLRGLKRVGQRPSLFNYLLQTFRYRQFIHYDALSRVQSGTREDRLGSLWLILQPVLNALIFFFIFGVLLNTGNGIENFIGYLVIGLFTYQSTSRAVSEGAKAISSNRNVVGAFDFPKISLVIAVNFREAISNVLVVITMLVIIYILPPVEVITWKVLLIVPALVLQFFVNLGLSLILARIVATASDFSRVIGFGMRFWMYMSAIFYPADRFEANPILNLVLQANPLFQVIDIIRDVVLYDTLPNLQSWGILGGLAVGLMIIGTLVFWQGEETYVRAARS